MIISRQSGVAEVLDYAIKVNYWDVDALALSLIHIWTRRCSRGGGRPCMKRGSVSEWAVGASSGGRR